MVTTATTTTAGKPGLLASQQGRGTVTEAKMLQITQLPPKKTFQGRTPIGVLGREFSTPVVQTIVQTPVLLQSCQQATCQPCNSQAPMGPLASYPVVAFPNTSTRRRTSPRTC